MIPMRIIAAILVTSLSAIGAVTEVYVQERTDVLNGLGYGPAGPYEKIVATAHFAVDPKAEANRAITDIHLAPRNPNGLVEFTADVVVFKPRDSAKGNGTILLDIPNRGGITVLRTFGGAGGDEFGDRYLLAQGYTVVVVGWQFDNPQGLKVYVPVARGETGPLRGLIRSQFIPTERTTTMPLADRSHAAYAPIDLNDPKASLTVRNTPSARATAIPRRAWKFADNGTATMAAGFEPGKIYELVYTAQDPPVSGLGFAAVRDFVSYLRYGGGSVVSALGDQQRFMKRSIAFGASQSGRFLRTLMYHGFNADEKGRKVLDGVWAHVAGGGRGSFNVRFAQPSRDGHPLLNLFYPTDLFPFADLPETDPETGAKAGLLDRTINTPAAPKVFYTNGSYEYWGRAASLTHTTADSQRDAPLAPDTRIYFLTGTQHGAGAKPDRNANIQNRANPVDYRWTLRALLAAFNAWITDGTAPPESQYPRIDRNQLVSYEATPFVRLPGVKYPASLYHAQRLDFGPEFTTRGIASQEPPKSGKPFVNLVPRVSLEDGNEIAGVRQVDLRVPVATYTGWNLRSTAIGAPDMLSDMIGSFVPFARTKAERAQSGDPRPSLEERYADKDEYMKKVAAASADLARERFLLQQDIPRVVAEAGERWDLVAQ
jgi:hypothetical protein